MSSSEDRYDRQRRLAEVGEVGQSRICQATLEVRGTDGAIIECEYLHRAGVQRVQILPVLEPPPFAHQEQFRFFAARRVGAGAWRALKQLHRVLGMGAE